MSYFTKAQLITILTLQAKANSVMSDAWLTSTNNEIKYYRASAVEAFEAIDHLGFKWWKKQEPNIEQAILELVDILHFASSDDIRYINRDTALDFPALIEVTAEYILQAERDAGYNSELNKEYAISQLENFVSNILIDQIVSVSDVIHLFRVFQVDAAKIYNMYVGKNTLNLFRNENGQRENKYIKIWQGQEDNYYLEQYFNDLDEGEAVDVEHLNAHLTSMYAFVLKNQESTQ